jgi:hypothetical protein
MKQALMGCALLMALFFAGLAQAQQGQMGGGKMGGGDSVSGKKHPNLAAAQHHIEEAQQKMDQAQSANEYDLGGHAKKAHELLDEADREIKQAAEFANKKGEKGQ